MSTIYHIFNQAEKKQSDQYLELQREVARVLVQDNLDLAQRAILQGILQGRQPSRSMLAQTAAQNLFVEALAVMREYCNHYGVSYFHRPTPGVVWYDAEYRGRLSIDEALELYRTQEPVTLDDRLWFEFEAALVSPRVVIDDILESAFLHHRLRGLGSNPDARYSQHQLQFLKELLERYGAPETKHYVNAIKE